MEMKTKMHKSLPIIIIIIGLLLFGIGSLPACEKEEKQIENKTTEQRLEEVLSTVEGAGAVSVVLAFSDNGEKFPLLDQEGKPVILRGEGEEFAATKEKTPTVSGVLIVAEGAADSKVRADLVAAVRALYGVSYEKISVLRGKK